MRGNQLKFLINVNVCIDTIPHLRITKQPFYQDLVND